MVLLRERLPTGFSPPLSIAQEVSRYLENKIILDELKLGTRLVERNLSESLGISRISIRGTLGTSLTKLTYFGGVL